MGKESSNAQRAWKRSGRRESTRGQYNYEACHRVSRIPFNFLSGGHLFETENGLFGMASGMVRKGDVICILFGCPMPIIMRKVGENWAIIQSAMFTAWMEAPLFRHGNSASCEIWRTPNRNKIPAHPENPSIAS